MNEEEYSYKTELDSEIKAYLKIYRSSFGIQGATSWDKYIYLMTDELLRHGLKNADVMHIKQKYAEFRCSVKTDDEAKRLTFNQIIVTYTNAINSICDCCERHGEKVSICNWDYRLCLEHFIQYYKKFNGVSIDEEIVEDLNLFYGGDPDGDTIKEEEYKNVFNSLYNGLNDGFTLARMSVIFRDLEEEGVDKSIIRKVLVNSFVGWGFGINVDGTTYFHKSYFEDRHGDNKIFPKKDFYSNEEYLLDVIDKMCRK